MKHLMAILAAVTLTGCASATVTSGCQIFRPLHGSKQDTAGTREQIDRHNARGIGACGWEAK